MAASPLGPPALGHSLPPHWGHLSMNGAVLPPSPALFVLQDTSLSFFFFLKESTLFIYFWLCWVFVAAHGLSLVVASGGYSLLPCAGFSLQWLLLLRSTGSRHVGFSSCGTQAQYLWCTGLVALQHVGSSRTRDRTCAGPFPLNFHLPLRHPPWPPLYLHPARPGHGQAMDR